MINLKSIFNYFANAFTFYGMDPVTATLIGAVAGPLIQGMMSPDQSGPAQTSPTATTPAPQAASAPDANVVRQSNTGGGAAGGGSSPASTLLTGAQGVDPNKLKLGGTMLTGV
jgi:hypothetical protein